MRKLKIALVAAMFLFWFGVTCFQVYASFNGWME